MHKCLDTGLTLDGVGERIVDDLSLLQLAEHELLTLPFFFSRRIGNGFELSMYATAITTSHDLVEAIEHCGRWLVSLR